MGKELRLELPEGHDIGGQVAITAYSSGELYLEVEGGQKVKVTGIELSGPELQVRIEPEW
jgi:hypothetical protein